MSTDNPQNKDLITDETGSHPIGTGVGTIGGALTGAAAGAIAGPIGIIIGAVAGGVAGGLAGHHVGEGLNPSAGVLTDDENAVGTGIGSTAGAIAGGIAGTLVGGPVGTAAGAAIGAGLGAYAGNEAEEVIDRNMDSHDYKNRILVERISQASKRTVIPLEDTVMLKDTTYADKSFVADTLNDRPLDERDYKKTDL